MKPLYYLPLLLSALLTAPVSANPEKAVEVEQLAKTSQSWNGQALPHYPKGKPEITVLKVTIPSGTKLPFHKHLVINAAVLLKGALTVVAENGQKLYLKQGEPIVELVNTWHYGLNESTTDVELIVFYAGVEGVPITVKK